MARGCVLDVAELSRQRRIGTNVTGECGIAIAFYITISVALIYIVSTYIAFGIFDRKGGDKQRTGNGQ